MQGATADIKRQRDLLIFGHASRCDPGRPDLTVATPSASRGGGSWNLASSVAIDRQRLAMGGSAAENATYRMASIEAGFERAAVQPAASVVAAVACPAATGSYLTNKNSQTGAGILARPAWGASLA